MEKFESYAIGVRDLTSEHHWKELSAKNFRISKPIVFCFGGNTAISKKEANGLCKIAQDLTGACGRTTISEIGTTEDVDFVGVSYGRIREDKTTGLLLPEEREEIFENIFKPLYCDEKGEFLPMEEMQRNFNKVTFFAFCHGALEVARLIERVYDDMVERGMDAVSINKAMDEMTAVAYSPVQKCGCPTLQVFSMKDETFFGGPGRLCGAVTGQFMEEQFDKPKGEGTVAFKEDDYTISVCTSALTNSIANEHGVGVVDRDKNWRFAAKEPKNGDEISQVVGYALSTFVANSIQNDINEHFTPKPNLDKLLDETNSILGDTKSDDFAKHVARIQQIRAWAAHPYREEVQDDSEGQTE